MTMTTQLRKLLVEEINQQASQQGLDLVAKYNGEEIEIIYQGDLEYYLKVRLTGNWTLTDAGGVEFDFGDRLTVGTKVNSAKVTEMMESILSNAEMLV